MIKTITLAIIVLISSIISGMLNGASFDRPMSFLIAEPPKTEVPMIDQRIDRTKIVPAQEVDPTLLEPYESDGLPQWEQGCIIPREVFDAIVAHAPADKRAWFAAVAKQESGFDAECYHYDNDGGYAHGLFCLHSHWRKTDVKWMGDQWRDPGVNLLAFQRTLRDHERYWPRTRTDLRAAAAHYNGGGNPNWVYADKVMTYTEQLSPYFKS